MDKKIKVVHASVPCLIKDCSVAAKSRGLCVFHYAIARNRVKSGVLSWDALVKKGMATVPASGPSGLRVSQFDAQLGSGK